MKAFILSLGASALLQASSVAGATNILHFETALTVSRTFLASVAFSPDSSRIAVGSGSDESIGGNGVVNVYQFGKETPEFKLGPFESTVRAICFSADGTIIAGGYPLSSWEGGSRKRKLTIKTSSSINEVAYLPRQQLVVAALMGGREVTVWNALSGKKVASFGFPGTRAVLTSLSLSTNASVLAVGGDGCPASLWDTRTWKMIRTFGTTSDIPDASLVRLSPDGSLLFSKGYSVKPGVLWRVRDGRPTVLQNDIYSASDAAFSPDGELLVIASFEGVHLWEIKTCTLLQKIKGDFESVAYSLDGAHVAAGSNKGTLHIYSVARE